MKKRIAANALIGGVIVAAMLVAAIMGAFWTPHDPLKINFVARLKPPGGDFLLGTDEFGRDELSRLLAGASSSVWISLLTVGFAIIAGTIVGTLTGFVRGWTDRIIMAFNNALLAFPGLLLALGLLAVVGANKYGIILALGLAYTPSVTRIVRGTVLSLREKEFIESSRVLGNSELYTMVRHVLPNCVAPLTVLATSMFGWVILAESALSFLGLGVPPPAPTWGNMLAAARPFMAQASYLSILPGLAIALALLGINLLGDAVRDRLDPRMRGVQ
ncbi:ABC transporter permease [Achromobacter sp. SIMBA_011]|jgi:peptide/nickel transport system permease protein|uniref:ABC transporter permease n=7 Tax=Achromobacter TaxID=222 RepID=A0A6S7C0K5_9BURK|nr:MULTISPECIES: ABC transporter permease [Achromobacter]ALX82797.1 peptide ABC transporter permease [Achromobacter denitrificans]MBQ2647988.1 ABC transporter permease [Achromobacter sp.]AKP88724.1 Dipeptide transport system permease protein DppC [Achromobacter xylosoxidans]AMG47847.1 ABC transporter permease [Achromobacter xylosoxidans]AOU91580.1 dipeptide transporter permease DppC [Achromobacter ruhlandii]